MTVFNTLFIGNNKLLILSPSEKALDVWQKGIPSKFILLSPKLFHDFLDYGYYGWIVIQKLSEFADFVSFEWKAVT